MGVNTTKKKQTRNMRRLAAHLVRMDEPVVALAVENVVGARNVLIGLTGRAGAGKDTIGDYLKNSWQFGKGSFAGPLKDACSSLFGVPRLVFENPSEKERVVEHWGRSPRWMAQWLGTEVMRDQYDTNFFLDRMDLMIKRSPVDRMVVTDVRYDNEAEFIKARGGVIWKIEAGERTACLSGETAMHRSEMGIKDSLVDATVDNSGDLNTTFMEVDNHLHGIKCF
jgi:hypothetical protein